MKILHLENAIYCMTAENEIEQEFLERFMQNMARPSWKWENKPEKLVVHLPGSTAPVLQTWACRKCAHEFIAPEETESLVCPQCGHTGVDCGAHKS